MRAATRRRGGRVPAWLAPALNALLLTLMLSVLCDHIRVTYWPRR